MMMLVFWLTQVVQGNVCVICRETMKSEDEFYAHCQQHHAAAITSAAVAASSSAAGSTVTPSSIPCIVCRQTLVSALELTLHARHHYRSNQQQQQQQSSCCVCSTTDGLLVPLYTTTNSLHYICLACERRNGLAQLDVVTSTSSKTFQCIKCQQSFASEDDVRAHVATHVLQDGSVHRCQLCSGDVSFDSPARLQAHIVAEHELVGVTEALCDVCGLTMSGPVAARQHAFEHGPTAWKHACRRCPLKFFFAAELRNHQLVEGHDDTSPRQPASRQSSDSVDDQLRCTTCSRTFSGYASLCSHRRVHENNKAASLNVPLDCTSGQPERSGSAPSQCVTASSEPRGTSLQCPECSRQFPSLSSLQGHMRVHSSGVCHLFSDVDETRSRS